MAEKSELGAEEAFSRSGTWFATTHWSVVLAAGGDTSETSTEALSELLKTYWRPLYGYLRRRGYSADHSSDLVQEFFLQMIQHHRLHFANPERGRFRSFLLACLNHFLSNTLAAQHALKRGGRRRFLQLTTATMEAHFKASAGENYSPEREYDRQWAMTLLGVVLGRLRDEQTAGGQTDAFECLKPCLEGDQPERRYSEIAAQLETTESAVKMRALRLRRRYRALILEEIGRTLADPRLVQGELDSLMRALRE